MEQKNKDIEKKELQDEKRVVFFNGISWYHRTKELLDDMTTKYGKKGGFATPEEAEKSYWEYEECYKNRQRELQVAHLKNTDVMFGEFLRYWFEHIYSLRIETTTKMIGAYTLYNLLLPNMEADIKLKYVTVEYLDTLLERASKICVSAGNKGRELLSLAMKDAVFDGFIKYNPVPETKPYPRPKPKIRILSKEKIKVLLHAAYLNPWYLEMLLALFCGLRKGDDDDKIRLNQRKPSKYKGLSRFGPEKNLQRINKFMKERPTFYKKLIQMKENFRFYLRCFYCITKVVILQFNSEKQDRISS